MIQPAPPPAFVAAPARHEVERSAARAFPFLDLYYRLGEAKRTRFSVAYRWRAVAPPELGGGWAPVSLSVLDDEGAWRAWPSSALGWLQRTPTAAELARRPRVRLAGPPGWRLAMILAPQLTSHLGTVMDPAELLQGADQFDRGVRTAGPLSVAIPAFRRVLFVGAQGGELVGADGRSTAMAPVKGELFATLTQLRAASALRFSSPPERVLLLPG